MHIDRRVKSKTEQQQQTTQSTNGKHYTEHHGYLIFPHLRVKVHFFLSHTHTHTFTQIRDLEIKFTCIFSSMHPFRFAVPLAVKLSLLPFPFILLCNFHISIKTFSAFLHFHIFY